MPDLLAPSLLHISPAPNSVVPSLPSVEVVFDEPVSGVDAQDLLINGLAATNLWEAAPGQFVFEFPEPMPGVVHFSWHQNHGISDRATPPNAFEGSGWLCVLDTSPRQGGVLISEFLAVNREGLRDEDGDQPDWIELWNTNAVTVSLGGWFLTDDANNLTKWELPNVTLEPGEYLLLFASGKNRKTDLARLHTNFQLSSGGEFLALANPRTNIVSVFAPAFPPQEPDVSYGRDQLSPQMVGFLVEPTPGAANIDTGPGFTPEVRFSVEGGTFVHPFQLHLSTSDPEATIHYVVILGAGTSSITNVPTADAAIYTGPIPIQSSVQVRARAFKAGHLPGPPRSETYIQLAPEALNFSSDLPILLLYNLGQGTIPTSGDQAAYMAIFEPDEATGRATLSGAPTVNTRIGLNIRGRGSQGYPKSAFAVECWDEYNQDKDVEVLGMPAESDWVLYATLDTDPVHIHNPLAREMSNILGRPASRTRFVEVFLNTDGGAVSYSSPASGHYNGLYVVIEKIKRGSGRVDVAALDAADTAPDLITGGYIFKSDDPPEADEVTFVAGRQRIIMVYPGKRALIQPQRQAQFDYVRAFFADFSNALFGPDWDNPETGYASYIDVDSWIDHSIVSVATFNVDAIRLSGYFYKDRGKPLEMGPIWDCDRALGSTDGRQFNPRRWRGQGGDQGTDYFNAPGPGPAHYWYGQLFRDIEFWQRFIDRYQAIRQGPYALTNLYAIIDRMIAEIAQAQPREQIKWGHLAPPRNADGQGTGTFATEVLWLKTWLANRLDFMDTNFLAQPLFSANPGLVSPGFMLSLTPPAKPNSLVYYTLDGSDPRSRGGEIASNALLYAEPIPIESNTLVIARAYNPDHRNLTGLGNPPLSSPWSGLARGTFVVQMPKLVITELMYHPDNPPDGGNPDDLEYIELKNAGTTTLQLQGFRLTDGVQFAFSPTQAVTSLPPGARVLIVKDSAAFSARHPGVTNIAGSFQGNLANNGERLALVGPVGERIHDFEYDDDWHPVTDGSGFSLVLVDDQAPLAAWATAEAWRPSPRFRGSPGAPDTFGPAHAPIRVNEVLANSRPPALDAIELFNPTGAEVDVGGWFLTDDFDRPAKFRIPDGTRIAPGGYVYFTEMDFNLPGDPNGFGLSRLGDEVYLFSGDGTAITGYYHGFEFGPSDPDSSLGRVELSTGEERFVTQRSVTWGAINSGPRIGPIVLRAISPEPVTSVLGTIRVEDPLHEYIELHNTSDFPVPLYDPLRPNNTWQISGGVDFTFPPGVIVPAHDAIIIVRFDPALDPYQTDSFRAGAGLASPLYGPFEGRLGNEDDRIILSKPGEPVAPPDPEAGLVPYIVLEEVNYSSRLPWPTPPDPLQRSVLHRTNLSSHADDPINWTRLAVRRPVIELPPFSQGLSAGGTATFSVAATGEGPLTYQWRLNGMDIPGATEPTHTVTDVTPADVGWYDVRVADQNGAVMSPLATLRILVPPLVVEQPQGGIVVSGPDIRFSVAITNTASLPISYQWRRGGILLRREINESYSSTYDVARFQAGHAGAYSVVVSNIALAQSGGLTSRIASVVVVSPPTNVIALPGSSPTLRSIVTTGSGNPAWRQWYFNGAILSPQTNATLLVPNVQADDEGIYTLYVTNQAGQVAAFPAGLGLRRPILLRDPLWLPAGAFLFKLEGIPYQNHAVQFATNLPPDWQTLFTFTYTNGLRTILDPGARSSDQRYYRALTLP